MRTIILTDHFIVVGHVGFLSFVDKYSYGKIKAKDNTCDSLCRDSDCSGGSCHGIYSAADF